MLTFIKFNQSCTDSRFFNWSAIGRSERSGNATGLKDVLVLNLELALRCTSKKKLEQVQMTRE